MTTLSCWRKSTRSVNTTTCVELHHNLAAVRDSKSPDGPKLTAPGLPELIRQIKAGQFDR